MDGLPSELAREFGLPDEHHGLTEAEGSDQGCQRAERQYLRQQGLDPDALPSSKG